MRIKKDDLVIILTGKERGMTGRVVDVLKAKDKVLVEGRNIVQRHRKAMGEEDEGGIIPTEAPIQASNVALYSEKAGRGVRTQARYVGTNGQLFGDRAAAMSSFGADVPAQIRKVRYAQKTDEIFD